MGWNMYCIAADLSLSEIDALLATCHDRPMLSAPACHMAILPECLQEGTTKKRQMVEFLNVPQPNVCTAPHYNLLKSHCTVCKELKVIARMQ